jgi:hypothetical protein
MRQGSPAGERGHEAKRSPAVTLDTSDLSVKTRMEKAGPTGPASLLLGLHIRCRRPDAHLMRSQ